MSQKKFFAKITVIVSIMGVVVGVMRYFEGERIATLKRQYDAEIAKLTRGVGTIERRLGSEAEFLEVRNLWLDATQVAEALPEATYHSNDGFYAPSHGDRWVYELTTDHAVLKRQLKAERIKQLLSVVPAQPIHIWRGKTTYKVTGNDLYKSLVLSVSVQRLSHRKFSELIKAGVDEGIKLRDTKKLVTAMERAQLVERLNADFRRDAAVNLFFSSYQLSAAFSMVDKKTSFELIRLQKLGNVLYAQFLTTFGDVNVGGQKFSEYYIWSELILISTEGDIYIVGTSVPTGDPAKRHRYFADVTQWLAEFAVLKRRTKNEGTGKDRE